MVEKKRLRIDTVNLKNSYTVHMYLFEKGPFLF